jgi:uncharacterized damage-inducible protein DinB
MINPEDNIPADDSINEEAGDQQSQKDIHSNGFDDANEEATVDNNQTDIDRMQQASDASEASFTLNLDDEPSSEE